MRAPKSLAVATRSLCVIAKTAVGTLHQLDAMSTPDYVTYVGPCYLYIAIALRTAKLPFQRECISVI